MPTYKCVLDPDGKIVPDAVALTQRRAIVAVLLAVNRHVSVCEGEGG